MKYKLKLKPAVALDAGFFALDDWTEKQTDRVINFYSEKIGIPVEIKSLKQLMDEIKNEKQNT